MGKKLLKTHKVDFSNDDLKFEWYTVVTLFNHERKVADMLEKRFESLGASDKLREIFVPIKEWEEEVPGRIKKDGTQTIRKVKKTHNFLQSGYIFIQVAMTNHVWNIVRQTTGVAGWLNMDGRPSQVSEEEISKFKQMINYEEFQKTIDSKKELLVGEFVQITEGPFIHFTGKIESIQDQKITLLLEQFNQSTIELNLNQIKTI